MFGLHGKSRARASLFILLLPLLAPAVYAIEGDGCCACPSSNATTLTVSTEMSATTGGDFVSVTTPSSADIMTTEAPSTTTTVSTTTTETDGCNGDCACELAADHTFCAACGYGNSSCLEGACNEFCRYQRNIDALCPRQLVGSECQGLDASSCPNADDCCVCNFCETQASGRCPSYASYDSVFTKTLQNAQIEGFCALENALTNCNIGDLYHDMSYGSTSECTYTGNCGGDGVEICLDPCDLMTDQINCDSVPQCEWEFDPCDPNPCQYFGDKMATCSKVTSDYGVTAASCACSDGYASVTTFGSGSLATRNLETCAETGCYADLLLSHTAIAADISDAHGDLLAAYFHFAMSDQSYAELSRGAFRPESTSYTAVEFSQFIGCGVLEYTHEVKGCCEWGRQCESCSQCASFTYPYGVSGVGTASLTISSSLSGQGQDGLFDVLGRQLNISCEVGTLNLTGIIDGSSCELTCTGSYPHGTNTVTCSGRNGGVPTTNFECASYTCLCPNGTPAPPSFCHENNTYSCGECDTNYTLNSVRDARCVPVEEKYVEVGGGDFLYGSNTQLTDMTASLESCLSACTQSVECEVVTAFDFGGEVSSEYESGSESGSEGGHAVADDLFCVLHSRGNCVSSSTIKVEGSDGCACIYPPFLQEAGSTPVNSSCHVVGSDGRCYSTEYGSQGCRAYDKNDTACTGAHCSQPWCYVNASSCDVTAELSVYFASEHLYYSYETCTEQIEATYCPEEMTLPPISYGTISTYSLRRRECFCENGSSENATDKCTFDGAEACTSCDFGYSLDFDGRHCVSHDQQILYHPYSNRNCSRDSTILFEIDVFTNSADRLLYGSSVSADECMRVCSDTTGCELISRKLDGSRCVGHDQINCGNGQLMVDLIPGRRSRFLTHSDFHSDVPIGQFSDYYDTFVRYKVCVAYWDNNDDYHNGEASAATRTCSSTDPIGGSCLDQEGNVLHAYGRIVSCDAMGDYIQNEIIEYDDACPDGHKSECGPFSDASPCASVLGMAPNETYCCRCGECLAGDACAEILSTDPVDIERDAYCAECNSVIARSGLCLPLIHTTSGSDLRVNCSTHDNPALCAELLSDEFQGAFSTYLYADDFSAKRCVINCVTSHYGGLVAPNNGDTALLYLQYDLYAYCVDCYDTVTGDTSSCSTCAPLGELPANISYVGGSATWIDPSLQSAFNVSSSSMVLPECAVGAQLTSFGSGSQCALRCPEGYVPQDGTSAYYKCDPTMRDGVPRTDLVCVEASCPPIDLSDYLYFEPDTEDSVPCENGTNLTALSNPSCAVRCSDDHPMVGSGRIKCSSSGTLQLDAACVPSCSALSFSEGVEGDDRSGNACVDAQRLNAESSPTCDVRCKDGYHANGATTTGSFDCVSLGSEMYGLSTSLECFEKTCANVDGLQTPANCNTGEGSLNASCYDGEVGDGYRCECPSDAINATVFNVPTSCVPATCAAIDLGLYPDVVSGGGSPCGNGALLGRTESCTVQCDVSRGVESQIATILCPLNAPNGSAPEGFPSCVESPCTFAPPANGGTGTCSAITDVDAVQGTIQIPSGSRCTPTCNDGYIQANLTRTQNVCERGALVEFVVCAAIPVEEVVEGVAEQFSIPFVVAVPEEDESVDDGGSDGADDGSVSEGACVIPVLSEPEIASLKNVIAETTGTSVSDVQNVRLECDETDETSRRGRTLSTSSSASSLKLFFDIKIKSESQKDRVREILIETSTPKDNETRSEFFEAYDQWTVENQEPTWEFEFSTNSDGEPILLLETLVSSGLGLRELSVLTFAFVNFTDPTSGQVLRLAPNTHHCAQMHDGILWVMRGFEAFDDSVSFDDACARKKSDPIVEFSAVVDSDIADTSSVQSSANDGSDTNSGEDGTVTTTVAIVCATVGFLSLTFVFVWLKRRHEEKLEREKNRHRVTMDQLARAEREELIEKHAKKLTETEFVASWRIPWKRIKREDFVRQGHIGPTFNAKLDLEGTGKDFMMAACILKGVFNKGRNDGTHALARPAYRGDDENWNAVLDMEREVSSHGEDYEVDVDVDALHRLHRVSQFPGIVYVFGMAYKPAYALRGCRWWLVCECLEGGSMDDALWSPSNPVAWLERTLWSIDICNALRYLHMSGLSHGNLKSANCMLYRSASCDDHIDTRGKMDTELARWAQGSFRRVRLTDLAMVRDVLKSSSTDSETKQRRSPAAMLRGYRAHLTRARSGLEVAKGQAKESKRELIHYIESKIEMLSSAEDDDHRAEADSASTKVDMTGRNSLLESVPTTADQGLQFWLAHRSQHRIDVNADIVEESTSFEKQGTKKQGTSKRTREGTQSMVDAAKRIQSMFAWDPWAAPECIGKDSAGLSRVAKRRTQHADMYSLGIILGEIISMRKPFYSSGWSSSPVASDSKTLKTHHQLALEVLGGLRPKISGGHPPKGFSDLMKRCWRQMPKSRPSSEYVLRRLRKIETRLAEKFQKRYDKIMSETAGVDDSGNSDVSEPLTPSTAWKRVLFSWSSKPSMHDATELELPDIRSVSDKGRSVLSRDEDDMKDGASKSIPILTNRIGSFDGLPPGIPSLTAAQDRESKLAAMAANRYEGGGYGTRAKDDAGIGLDDGIDLDLA